jgi:hypothetical protein
MKAMSKVLAMAGMMAAGMGADTSGIGLGSHSKYPSGTTGTAHGHYTPGQYKRRKAAKRAQNQARNRQH